jgi:hypothetical protein
MSYNSEETTENEAYIQGFHDGFQYAMYHGFWRGFSCGGMIMLAFATLVFILLRYTIH